MARFETILFDFDGTLLDTEWIIYKEVLAIFQREGHDLPLEQYVKCIGSSYAKWSPQTYLEELTGKEYDWEAINEERNQKIRARLATQGPMPGARLAIEACHELGYRLGVVSSSSHDWVDGWLEKLELESSFEHVTCRGDAPKIKPAPDLFLKGAKRMKTDPAKCLVIEDSYNGMLAAHAAGMDVVAIPNRITKVSDFAESFMQLDSLMDLPPALSRLAVR